MRCKARTFRHQMPPWGLPDRKSSIGGYLGQHTDRPSVLTPCLLPSLACSTRSQGPPPGPARVPEANARGSEALGESWRLESYKYLGGGVQFHFFLVFLPIPLPYLDPSRSLSTQHPPPLRLSHPRPRLLPLLSFAICLPSWLSLCLRSGNTGAGPELGGAFTETPPPQNAHPTQAS